VDGSIHVDTGLLREHVSVVLEEKRIAMELQSHVETLMRISGDSARPQYQSILNRIENLVLYYQKMADALETVGEDAVMLHREIASKLRDDNDEATHVVSQHLML